MTIKVTSVKISGKSRGRFLAYATVLLDGCVLLRGIRIIRATAAGSPPMVAMPAIQMHDGQWQEHYHPVTKDARVAIEEAVRQAYGFEAEKK